MPQRMYFRVDIIPRNIATTGLNKLIDNISKFRPCICLFAIDTTANQSLIIFTMLFTPLSLKLNYYRKYWAKRRAFLSLESKDEERCYEGEDFYWVIDRRKNWKRWETLITYFQWEWKWESLKRRSLYYWWHGTISELPLQELCYNK